MTACNTGNPALTTPGGSNLPPDQMTARAQVCADCGHTQALHYGFGWVDHNGCSASVDTRHPASGGDTLTPCKCRGFRVA